MTPTADALAGLRDIHLPDPVAFWPPAPGWWIVAALGVALAAAAWLRARRRRNSAEARARRLLDELAAEYARSGDAVALCSGLSALLRRVALARSRRAEVAGLHGPARAHALAGGARGAPAPFELIESLEQVVYAGPRVPVAAGAPEAWIEGTRRFLGRPR